MPAALLLLVVVSLLCAKPAQAAERTVEGEDMALSDSNVMVRSETGASGDKAVGFYGEGSASQVRDGEISRLSVTLRGKQCDGAPHADVKLDGRVVMSIDVANTSFQTWSADDIQAGPGSHALEVAYTNDYSTSDCDRNLYFDELTVSSPDNPFAGESFYVDPNSDAKETEERWRGEGRDADADQIKKISEAPADPKYFAEWTERYGGVEFQVRHWVGVYEDADSLPVLGAYAIPNRDCGDYSAGGFTSPEEYKDWIDGFARGIGSSKAVVFLEPDAIPKMDCLTPETQQERLDLLKYAVYSLKSNPNTYVYVDAGHSAWHDPQTVVDRLKKAGIEKADGFSTNISNFQYTQDEISWGDQVSAGVGYKHFVVDTSRNGLGPYTGDQSGDCLPEFNPPDRALGERPTADTGEPLVDAFYWLKQPGDSDGECGGYPPAGSWAPEYALGLAKRAAY